MHSASHNFGVWSKCETINQSSNIPISRVGHTAHYLPVNDRSGWILLVGGANLSFCCPNYFLYNLRKGQIEACNIPEIDNGSGVPRYEQASVMYGDELVQFGGANSESPLNDVLHFKMSCDVLTEYGKPTGDLLASSCVGSAPPEIEKRTQHSSNCMTDCGELVVFAGGGMGSCPVKDTQVHLYNIKRKAWIVVKTNCEGPCPRMGHLMFYRASSSSQLSGGDGDEASVIIKKSTLYVSGGMSGLDFFDDFWRLDIERSSNAVEDENVTGVWERIGPTEKVTGSELVRIDDKGTGEPYWPAARAAHGGALLPSPLSQTRFPQPLSRIFIFGGVNSHGPLNDFAYFDEGSLQWTTLLVAGSNLPSPRMDFAFTSLRIQVRDPNYVKAEDSSTFTKLPLPISSKQPIPIDEKAYLWRNYLFIHGGMNTEEKIFNDVYVCCLDEEKL